MRHMSLCQIPIFITARAGAITICWRYDSQFTAFFSIYGIEMFTPENMNCIRQWSGGVIKVNRMLIK